MLALTPLQWLLAGLALILLVLLYLMIARRWNRARLAASHYRTANGRLIELQSAHILRAPMATAKRPMPQDLPRPPKRPPLPITPILHTGNSRAFWPAAKASQIASRARSQAQFDWAVHGRKMAGPYTAGTVEHTQWRAAYDAAFAAEDAPAGDTAVQTTARPESLAA